MPRLKRLSSILQRQVSSTDSLNDSVTSNNSFVEDVESEQEEIRERKERQKNTLRRSILGSNVVDSPGVPTGLSAAQLTQHYSHCIKMSAENKINVKNAFSLNMIDTMAEMLKNKGQTQLDNFQSASCALDASTKIYGYRVDNVYTQTLKLASGVGRNKAEGGEVGRNQEQNIDGEGGLVAKKKKRKKANTVEKNLNNINCSKFDLEFDMDPLFKKVSAQFDSGGGGGQFLSTLRMSDDRGELVLDSNTQLESFRPQNRDEFEVNINGLHLEWMATLENKSLTCGVLDNFSFRNWNIDAEEEDDVNNPLSMPVNEDHAFDANAIDDLHDGDDGGFFDDDLGGGMEALQEDERRTGMPMDFSNVKKIRDHLAAVPNEYTYFDTGRLGAWAGPGHWKFKPMQRKLPNIGTTKKGKKKEKEKLDFDALDAKNSTLLDIVQKAMRVPKKSIQLLQKTMDNWNDDKNLIPDDIRYSGKDFVNLEFVKASVAPGRAHVVADSVDEVVDDYNYNNLNDTLNYCPDLGGEGSSYPADNNIDSQGDFTNVYSQPANDEMGLVAAPNRVEKVHIGYAKLAKKIDMRKLKSVEWSILQDKTIFDESNKENNKDVCNVGGGDSGNGMGEKAELTFSEMYKTLNRHNGPLPNKMVDSLSIPLAFVALLHLCNEKVLELENGEAFADLKIRKG